MANMMVCRKFEITLVSADNLPDIRSFGRMKVYAEVSINGESKTSKKTNVDYVGERNPTWNFPLGFWTNESSVQKHGLEVMVKLYCKRTFGDTFIGQVKIPVKSIYKSGVKAGKELSYPVAGTRDGRLNISYSFGDTFLVPVPSAYSVGTALRTMSWVVLHGVWFAMTGDIGPLFQ